MSPANSINMLSPAYTKKSDNIYLVYKKDDEILVGNKRLITVPAGVYDKSQKVTI